MRSVRRISAMCGLVALIAALADAQQVRLVREELHECPSATPPPWTPVVTHTHNWRWPDGDKPPKTFEQSQRDLVEWCRKIGVRALGLGSPWDPVSFQDDIRYQGVERDAYYAGRVNPETVMDREVVLAVIADLNSMARGSTLFYLDNETPKSRLGHVWWFGFQYEKPAWHDYSQDRPIQTWSGDPDIEVNKVTGQPHRRRDLFEIMAIEHRAGALGVFAHPTRWWVSDDHYWTNIAAQAGLFLTVYGRLDGLTVMGDRPFNAQYQKLWFHFLDTGAIVPGFAETDFLLTGAPFPEARTFRNYMALPQRFDASDILAAARRGESFASNGIFLTMRVDDRPMGSVVRTRGGVRHTVILEACPAPGQNRVRVELIGTGARVLFSHNFSGGRLTLQVPGSDSPGYVVARAFGEGDDPAGTVRMHAITNPIYLHPAGFKRPPAHTECTLTFRDTSPWLGGTLTWETADGGTLATSTVRPGPITRNVPADARVRLVKVGHKDRVFYIATENPAVERCVQYLSLGQFRHDYPGIKQGEVPVEAFRLQELDNAVRKVHLEL